MRMKVQQAPSPVHAAFALPVIVAPVMAHSTKGGTAHTRRAATAKVSTVLGIELKRFCRSQARARLTVPVTLSGTRPPEPVPGLLVPAAMAGLATSIDSPDAKIEARVPRGSALHQRDPAVVPIHQAGARQVDRHEDRPD